MVRVLAVAAGLLVAVAAGCAAPLGEAPSALDEANGAVAAPAAPGPAPTTLRIPRLGLTVGLGPLGLDPDGSIQEPPVTRPGDAGWYSLGVRPGDPGPAVILGHVSGRPEGAPRAVPGVFAHLDQLRPGDEVVVDRTEGPPARFVVYDRKTVLKDRFPTQSVYGDTPGPELRLITCGGEFRQSVRSYASNVIVWARAAEVDDSAGGAP